MSMKKGNSKSPLREPPRRLPGQSIDEEINRLSNAKLVNYLLFALVFFLLASIGWVQTLNQSRINPWVMSVVAAPVISYSAFGFWQTLIKIRRLKLGRDGERAVAEQLDVLKGQGAVVLHDLIGDGFNLDHVILSSQGVFVVETKTHSKPIKGSPTVTFDGKRLLVNGFEPERNPVAQAEGNARWLAQMLRSSTGKEFPVRGVVLFPGWFVERCPEGSSVWVLNPKALPSFIEHEPNRVSESDLHMATYHLGRYIRTQAQGYGSTTR
jgi:hypothetical protein